MATLRGYASEQGDVIGLVSVYIQNRLKVWKHLELYKALSSIELEICGLPLLFLSFKVPVSRLSLLKKF